MNPEEIKEAHNKPDPRLITKSKLVLATRIGRAAAAVGAVVLASVAATLQVVRGDFSGVISLAKAFTRAVDPFDRLRKGDKVQKASTPKEREKWQDLTAGKKIVRVASIIYDTLLSKAAKRVYKLAGVGASLVANPTPVGFAIASASVTAMGYNITKETLEVHEQRKNEHEKTLLQNIKTGKDQQIMLLSSGAINESVKQNPALKTFIQDTSRGIHQHAEKYTPEVPFKGNRFIELTKVVRDNAIEAGALIAEGLDGGIVGKLLSAATVLGNVNDEATKKLVAMERNHIVANEIENLKWVTEPYKNLEELKELERQERVSTETMKRFTEDPAKLNGLNEAQLAAKFAVIQKQVEQEPEFASPLEKTTFQKFSEGAKELGKSAIESQFGDLKEAYGLNQKEDKIYFQPSTINPELVYKDKEKAMLRTKHMQENLDENTKLSYKPSIAPPESPHKEKQHSSRGIDSKSL